MNTPEIFIWQGIHYQTTEYLTVTKNTGWTFKSIILGVAEGQPTHIRYEIQTDNAWQVQRVVIEKESGQLFHLQRTRPGWTDKAGEILPALKDCIDVDISYTPCTNTLPVRRLNLQQGESAQIDVVYFDMDRWQIRPMKQQYTRKRENIYQYENRDGSGFKSEIRVDASGFVIHYPEIWHRIFPV